MHSSTISTFYQRDTTNSACLFYPLDSPWELELCILYRIYRIIKLNLSMCLFLCSLMYGHSFEHIWTKFGVWQPYTLWMVIGRLASAARARRLALRAPSIYAAANGWRVPSGIRNQRAAGATNRAPQARGVTERHRWDYCQFLHIC